MDPGSYTHLKKTRLAITFVGSPEVSFGSLYVVLPLRRVSMKGVVSSNLDRGPTGADPASGA